MKLKNIFNMEILIPFLIIEVFMFLVVIGIKNEKNLREELDKLNVNKKDQKQIFDILHTINPLD